MTLPESVTLANLLLLFIVVLAGSLGWRGGGWLWEKMDNTSRAVFLGIMIVLFLFLIQKG